MTDLLAVSEEEYGPEYRAHLMDQYKLYVQMSNHVSERRVDANKYLLTVNAFLITLYGLSTSSTSIEKGVWLYVVPLAGIAVCLTWLATIKSHRDLNTAKFKVIHELEQGLPAALYDREWALAEEGKGSAYKPISHIEGVIPWVFAALYALLALFALCSA